MMSYLKNWWNWFGQRSLFVKILILVVLLGVLGWGGYSFVHPKGSQVQYQTAQAQKGTLIMSVSASGSVIVGNKAAVTTQASGVVSQVLVQNGDSVSAGETIATITLDQHGQQKQQAAWATYQSAQNALNSAQATQYTLQNQEFVANQKFMNDAVANQKATDDPLYIEEDASWLAAEAAYKNQAGVISQAQTAASNAWLSYETVSPTITAPIAGTVTDLTITPGMQISGSNGSSTTTTADVGQQIASINTGGVPIVTVNIAEVDVPKVAVGDKTTLTFDALPNETFTGKIIGINTTGVVSSGVTTYPATIVLDSGSDKILPNMSVTANIITKIDDNVLTVPSSAVQTTSNGSTVRVLQNGKVTVVPVTIGDSSDTDTQITSGLSEGQTVVTSIIVPTTGTSTSGGTSPFSGLGGGRGFGGGGGAVFFRAGGGGGGARGG